MQVLSPCRTSRSTHHTITLTFLQACNLLNEPLDARIVRGVPPLEQVQLIGTVTGQGQSCRSGRRSAPQVSTRVEFIEAGLEKKPAGLSDNLIGAEVYYKRCTTVTVNSLDHGCSTQLDVLAGNAMGMKRLS